METLFFKPTGKYKQQVTGESHYQTHLSYLASLYDDGLIEAVDLFLEDHNQYDSNAVVVTIEGEEVGHLSRPDAVRYRERLKALGHPAAIGVCRGKLTGGHTLDDGSQAHYGLVLDLDIDNLEIEDIARSKTSETSEASKPKKESSKKPASKASRMSSKAIFGIVVATLAFIIVCGFSCLTFAGGMISILSK
jgi:hypothetical protein